MRDLAALSFGVSALMAVSLSAHTAFAQSAPSSCVAQLEKEYGSGGGLEAECSSKADCTFRAPTGNASARALIETIAKKAEDCFKAAGLKISKEETSGLGATRMFDGNGEAQCAVLTSAPAGPPPEGVRTVCQPK